MQIYKLNKYLYVDIVTNKSYAHIYIYLSMKINNTNFKIKLISSFYFYD